MEAWQTTILVLFLFYSILGFVKGLHESKDRKNAYGSSTVFNLLGAFVWADAVVFGIFWVVVVSFCLYLNDWLLFLLVYSVFWMVRSVGEVIYWFNQQHSTVIRKKPEDLWFFKYFHNDSVWFVYQIYWQCFLVITIILSVYLFNLWLT